MGAAGLVINKRCLHYEIDGIVRIPALPIFNGGFFRSFIMRDEKSHQQISLCRRLL